MTRALTIKQSGNDFFQARNYQDALKKYKQAYKMMLACLEEKDVRTTRNELSKVFANAAECLLRLEQWNEAATMAGEALEYDADNFKAAFRRAKGLSKVKRYLQALHALDKVNQIDAAEQLFEETCAILDAKVLAQQEFFEKIIDSYRLRVDDVYTRTGYISSETLYGMKREHRENHLPICHFIAYVRAGVMGGSLPKYLDPDRCTTKFQALLYHALTDSGSWLGNTVEPHDVSNVMALRKLARDVMGEIPHSVDAIADGGIELDAYMHDELFADSDRAWKRLKEKVSRRGLRRRNDVD